MSKKQPYQGNLIGKLCVFAMDAPDTVFTHAVSFFAGTITALVFAIVVSQIF